VLEPGRATLPEAPLPGWDAGFACLMDDRGWPVVYWLDPNGSAAKAGLKAGDAIISVNGKRAADLLDEMKKLLSTWYGFSSDRVLEYDAVRWIGRQMKQGDAVKLSLENPQGEKKDLDLKADVQPQYIPRLPVPIAGVGDSQNTSFTKLSDDIGYLYVRRIRDGLDKAIDNALRSMGECKGLIIDVRGNSGGGLSDYIATVRNFNLEDGKEPLRPRHTGPIAILIDGRCISAGEGWTSWFVTSKRAKLYGSATAGASSAKDTYTLTNGLYKVVVPRRGQKGWLDRMIERRGLEPDVEVRCSAKDLARGVDTVLERAKKDLIEQAQPATTQAVGQ
jgi:C-terminal processing protease CtpA/Prc